MLNVKRNIFKCEKKVVFFDNLDRRNTIPKCPSSMLNAVGRPSRQTDRQTDKHNVIYH